MLVSASRHSWPESDRHPCTMSTSWALAEDVWVVGCWQLIMSLPFNCWGHFNPCTVGASLTKLGSNRLHQHSDHPSTTVRLILKIPLRRQNSRPRLPANVRVLSA